MGHGEEDLLLSRALRVSVVEDFFTTETQRKRRKK
jgi:hypothetical protein